MRGINLFIFFSLAIFLIGLSSAVECSSITNRTSCDFADCEWEFNASNQYECRDTILVDYCSPFVTNFDGCIAETNLAGCYWEMDFFGTDCMPVDGNCSSRTSEDCEGYAGCTNSNSGCIGQNQLLGVCSVGNSSNCEDNPDCSWEDEIEGGLCIVDCYQYDAVEGGDMETCFEAYGGGICKWDDMYQECDPFGAGTMGEDSCFICHNDCGMSDTCHQDCDENVCMGEGMSFSNCFFNDGNMTGCKADMDCVWMPMQYCSEGDFCYDESGNEEYGMCNPSIMNFGLDVNCIQYDGNKDGCDNAIAFGDSCEWFSDPWGPMFNGTEAGWCNSMMGMSSGCWDNFNEEGCNASADMGMPCEWKSDSYGGWCEQKGCWSYDGNQVGCENITLTVLNCSYDSTNNFCYENFGSGCGEHDGQEFDCYATGFCFWNPADNSCKDPFIDGGFVFEEFFNPGCWIFDMPGASTQCGNITTCNWDGNCNDNGADANNGIQCVDINNSEMCNNIPMLSTCCAWNGTGCEDAQYSKTCWDNMQEPPAGAMFCEDFNAVNNQTICELIASDPWFMPCEWNATGNEQCGFAFNDMFGTGEDFGLKDIGSKQNCESAGGIWKSETWKDPSGIVYNDEWCEMGFGIGYETCDSSCWACEFQNNGTDWGNATDAQNACESSTAFNSSCVFYSDTNAFNDYGWCDINMSGFIGDMNFSAFIFEDCMGLIDSDGDGFLPADDPDCFDFFKNGFIDIEKGTQCGDNIDNDGNGLTDCEDFACVYDSYYCSQDDINDTTYPIITWFEVNSYPDGSFIGIDTNEPTNATVSFYKDDNSCENVNTTILDWKLSNSFDLDDYDVWHDIPIDMYTLGYNLDTNTSYYYKTNLCDYSGNCIISACSNFTTGIEEEDFTVSFDLPPPRDDVTEYLGSVQVGFDLNGDGIFNDSVIDSAHGLQFNASMGRDVDIKFSNPNSTKEWGIYFIGADLLKVLSMDISDAFVINETSEGDVLLGMRKDNWNELAQSLGVDYVRIVMPQVLNDVATGSVKHCPDDASGPSDADCVELDLEDINCTFGSTSTTCEIPVNIGFSVFAIEDDYVAPASSSSSSGGGGGGGGGSSSVEINNTPIVKKYGKGGRYGFKYGGAEHSLTINEVMNNTVNITIASTPVSFILEAGESAKADLDEDGVNDIEVKILNITDVVEFSIAKIEEEVANKSDVESEISDAEDGLEGQGEVIEEEVGWFRNNIWWFIGGVVVILLVGGMIWKKK